MSERASPPTWVRQAVDFGALIAFAGAFLFYRLNGLAGDEALVQATWFLVAGAAVAVAVGLVVERRLALMPLIVGGFALVFGLLTVLTQDDLWVKLKVTILNLSLSILLLGGLRMGKQPLKALLGSVIPINDRAWKILTLRYGLFFAAVALVNEAVRSEALVGWATGLLGYEDIDPADVWVSFRGVLWIASSVFGLSNMPLIFRNLQSETGDEAVTPPPGPNAAP
ncbi:MAG: septation protein IspZ [Brevundimonas sp.]|nr:septation protein IspZ [Brevundimonas sp.]